MPKSLRLAGLLTLVAAAAHAQSYPQVTGPSGSKIPPQAVSVLGVLSDGVTPCVIGAAGCLAQTTAASGQTPLTGVFTAAGPSASFTPQAGRGFDIALTGSWVGQVQLERQINGVWQPLTVSAGGAIVQVYLYTGNASDIAVEPQAGVSYRLNCTTFTSGAISYSISQ
jgi:hypothetical protein